MKPTSYTVISDETVNDIRTVVYTDQDEGQYTIQIKPDDNLDTIILGD